MVKISNDILRKKHHTGSWKTVGRIRETGIMPT